MKQRTAAFTLIELLVVIAIIAILAAILFPVFAQAKTAAKKAATISNMKQVLTAFQIYVSDYDDTFPYRGTMNGNGQSWATGTCNVEAWGCPTWDKVLYPYQKNYQLFDSALDRSPKKPSNLGEIKRSFRVANNVIRGVGGVNTWGGSTLNPVSVNSATAIPSPASSIMLTEQRNEAQFYSNDYWIWSTFWEEWVWGAGSANTLSYKDVNPNQLASGIDFDSANGTANFGYTDTHVKSAPRGYIFPGYRRSRGVGQPEDPSLRGVCLDADDWGGNPASNDCPLPQQ
ncbi:MAG: prepilin-type N-terminal cleavage/methylation domain-containing protein [Fimbriimonadaceae bacterium]|nr:prepilin-type N-terminal cleavage/methylation domain-containing protein [Fimbriimonadaceae bacterium]